MTIDDLAPPRARRRVRLGKPSELIERLRAENPAATADYIQRLYCDTVYALSAYNDLQVEGWAITPLKEWLRANVKDPPPPPEVRAARRAQSEAVKRAHVETWKQRIDEKIEVAATIRLLEHVTPNGTMLGDCTGAQCRNLGGWYGEVAKRLNPRDHVRGHLDNIELLAIAKRHRVLP